MALKDVTEAILATIEEALSEIEELEEVEQGIKPAILGSSYMKFPGAYILPRSISRKLEDSGHNWNTFTIDVLCVTRAIKHITGAEAIRELSCDVIDKIEDQKFAQLDGNVENSYVDNVDFFYLLHPDVVLFQSLIKIVTEFETTI